MKGCVISSANEGGYHRLFYYPQYHKKRDSHINSLFIAWPRARLWYLHCQCIGDLIVLLYIYNHRTNDTWAQSSDICLPNHLRYCSAFRTSSSVFQKRDQCNDDMIQVYNKLSTVDMRSWTELTLDVVQYKIFCRTIVSGYWAVVWYRKKMGCPNIQPHKFGGQLRTQIQLPDGHFGQSRAIEPMELLRPVLSTPEICLVWSHHSWGDQVEMLYSNHATKL